MRILSGIKPSGKLHVGNELGAVRNWLALQDDPLNECFFMIVDWHALTQRYEPSEKRAQIRELAVELLAAGIDPERVTFFRQSDLPEHLELAWYFSCVSPVGELERMTQYKDKVARGESPNVGLFTYPILQVADILMYSHLLPGDGAQDGAEPIGVPVGHDQVQHVELTNDVARRFNNQFGPTFPDTKPLLTEHARVMSLKDPSRKMDKSAGPDHVLSMDDPPEEVERKIQAAVTDSGPETESKRQETRNKRQETGGKGQETRETERRMSPGVQTLFDLLEAFGHPREIKRFREEHDVGTIKYRDLKPAVAEAVIAAHAEFREQKRELLADPDRVEQILADGAERARAVAAETMATVRERVGIR